MPPFFHAPPMDRLAFVALGQRFRDEPYIAQQTQGTAVIRLDVRRIFSKDPGTMQGGRGSSLEELAIKLQSQSTNQ